LNWYLLPGADGGPLGIGSRFGPKASFAAVKVMFFA
jgi:hypothetical protein